MYISCKSNIMKSLLNIRSIRYLVLIILIGSQYTSFSQSIEHWETIVRVGDSCRYKVPDRDLGTDWREKNFDDSGWELGQSGFGFADGDDNTLIPEGSRLYICDLSSPFKTYLMLQIYFLIWTLTLDLLPT